MAITASWKPTIGDTFLSNPALVPSLVDGTHSVLKHRLKGAQGSFPYGHDLTLSILAVLRRRAIHPALQADISISYTGFGASGSTLTFSLGAPWIRR